MCGQENVFSLVQDVRRKIMQAHCPAKPEIKVECTEAEEEGMHLEKDELMNPCLDYLKYIIFSKPGATFQVSCMAQTPRKEIPTISLSQPRFVIHLAFQLSIHHFRAVSCLPSFLPVGKWHSVPFVL